MEMSLAVTAALERLSPEQKETVILKVYQGFKFEEIAEILAPVAQPFELDPALKQVEDPLTPASVVVHAVRHADAQFIPRDSGLAWADPLECLFDLYEARLDMQAGQFLEALQRQRPNTK